MSKSERLELRLDKDMVDRLDYWRNNQEEKPSRSEAARHFMERGLSEKVAISGGERLILTLLRDLHKHHEVESEADPDFIMEAILGGHHWALEWELQGLFHGEFDRERTVREVVDILDMWSCLENAVEGFSEKENEYIKAHLSRSGGTKFVGFDGNNEHEYLGIAHFLIEKMGRFERFKGRSLNSHSPRVEVYRRMLSEFTTLQQKLIGRPTSPNEVIKILNERIHPENR